MSNELEKKYMPVKAVHNNVMRREQIEIRQQLLKQMVGTLYPGIISQEVYELTNLVINTKFKLVYFKPSGKFYTEEEVEWPEDPDHWSRYVPLEKLRPKDGRLSGMVCVAIETPLGYPLMDNPYSDMIRSARGIAADRHSYPRDEADGD